MTGYIFGGNTGETAESLRRRRSVAEAMLERSQGVPQNFGQGITALAQAYFGRQSLDRVEGEEKAQRERASEAFSRLIGGGLSPQPNPSPVVEAQPLSGRDMGQFREAIASIESAGSGDYAAIGPEVNGDRAHGRYQVMGANVGPWTEEILGRWMTPDEFRQSPQAQDAVFDARFGGYMDQHGGDPRQAASMWFSGRPIEEAGNASDGFTTVPEYLQKFDAGLSEWKPSDVATALANARQQPQPLTLDPQLVAAASDPFLDQSQRSVAMALLQRQIEAMTPADPLQALRIEKMKLENEELRNPSTPTMTPYQRAMIDLKKREIEGKLNKPEGAPEYGLTPQYGVDEAGNPVLIQLAKDGTSVQTPLPEGVELSTKPIKLDAGTHYVLLDPITRQPVGQIEKAVSETAAATAIGKAEGEKEAGKAKAVGQAERMLGDIDAMLSDANLDNALGWGSYLPDIPGYNTEQRSRIEKLQGGTFLQAFESLKGGGQITEIEGKKAEAAMARLKTAQTDAEFRLALNELREVVSGALTKLGIDPPAAPGDPRRGSDASSGQAGDVNVDDLLEQYGG